MGRRADYRKVSELSCWDIDRGCRGIVDTSTEARRRLRDVIRRQDRKRQERTAQEVEDDAAD